jgi:hypothetical protein
MSIAGGLTSNATGAAEIALCLQAICQCDAHAAGGLSSLF